jgi:uncharacterized protein (DUF924 family)
MEYQAVIDFWFKEIDSKLWWEKDPNLDQLIKDRFQKIHSQAIKGELYNWRNEAKGRLAEIIVLDQFSRNIYRNSPLAFAYDSIALVLAQEAIFQKIDLQCSGEQKAFFYLPFMHSESKLIHEVAIKLYSQPDLKFNLEFEIKHKTIIDRFGRYPHRNAILGRESTKEEKKFLLQPNSSF